MWIKPQTNYNTSIIRPILSSIILRSVDVYKDLLVLNEVNCTMQYNWAAVISVWYECMYFIFQVLKSQGCHTSYFNKSSFFSAWDFYIIIIITVLLKFVALHLFGEEVQR